MGFTLMINIYNVLSQDSRNVSLVGTLSLMKFNMDYKPISLQM